MEKRIVLPVRADRFWDKAWERALGAAPALFCFCAAKKGPGPRRRADRQRGKERGIEKSGGKGVAQGSFAGEVDSKNVFLENTNI